MITLRKANDRGRSQISWLDSYHTFSFSSYFDPDHSGFSELLVINEDRVIPAGGFPTHSHQDMEIITYVLSGSLEHKDSIGNTSIIYPGDTQRMSAGKGITHSEFNSSDEDPVHFLQIWIQPNVKGIDASYEQKHVPAEKKQGSLKLIASAEGGNDSVKIHQDVKLYASILNETDNIDYTISPNRNIYIHIAKGDVTLNDFALSEGDGAKITGESKIKINSPSSAEILLFDLP